MSYAPAVTVAITALCILVMAEIKIANFSLLILFFMVTNLFCLGCVSHFTKIFLKNRKLLNRRFMILMCFCWNGISVNV